MLLRNGKLNCDLIKANGTPAEWHLTINGETLTINGDARTSVS
jgi:hypothetical protein